MAIVQFNCFSQINAFFKFITSDNPPNHCYSIIPSNKEQDDNSASYHLKKLSQASLECSKAKKFSEGKIKEIAIHLINESNNILNEDNIKTIKQKILFAAKQDFRLNVELMNTINSLYLNAKNPVDRALWEDLYDDVFLTPTN